MDPPWLQFLTSRTITKLGPRPKYTLDASFNDAEISHGVREEPVTCMFHHRTLGGSVDPPWLRFLASRTLTKLGPGPKYTLDPRFNYAEIPHGVREEPVTCKFHHRTLGGSVDPPWLRFLASRTLTKLGPGPKYTLETRFNDAEIPHGVREEPVTCKFHHRTLGGSVDPPWLRFLASRTLTKLGPGPKYTLETRFNDAEIPHGVREEPVTCKFHHWTLGGSIDAEIPHGVREEHVTC